MHIFSEMHGYCANKAQSKRRILADIKKKKHFVHIFRLITLKLLLSHQNVI